MYDLHHGLLEAERTRSSEKGGKREKGEIEVRILTAKRLGLLDSYLADVAHGIRIRANNVLHGQATSDDSFITLSDTRTIVERLFTAA